MTVRVPLALVGAAAAAVVLVAVAAVVQPSDGVPRPVVLLAELLIAGGAAVLLDDPARPLTTVTPFGVWRRRMPRLVAGGAVIATAWALVLGMLQWQDSLPRMGLATGEMLVLCLVAVAAAAVLASRGEAEPGGLVAPGVGLLGVGALIADLLTEAAIFVPWDGSGGVGVRLAWGCLGGFAVLALVLASLDPARSGVARSSVPRGPRKADSAENA